ncbi:hypothetical protein Dret_2335 [Desulfohalobium retbaense DSM 5692]|uniref:Uncharacterized protein n=1 Tax=Desulfohalobium retbaense (strain ATCC 49708 / DSM 5692 / JCM 16813 / HR100) TaxID=485915 RepID=C8X5C1_DESRD|nr:hypothetical protein Dret_2335 [Desulfohalobium retbaense DSM 5692]
MQCSIENRPVSQGLESNIERQIRRLRFPSLARRGQGWLNIDNYLSPRWQVCIKTNPWQGGGGLETQLSLLLSAICREHLQLGSGGAEADTSC